MIETPQFQNWDYLGPFTLVGVGNEASAAIGADPGKLIPTSGNIVTLSTSKEQEREKNLLYRYLAAMRGEFHFNESLEHRSLMKIVAVEPELSDAAIFPKKVDQPSIEDFSKIDGGRLIFVSLDDIPSAPPFMRIGERIYFVVPPGKDRIIGHSFKK